MSFINDNFMLKNEPAKKLYAMVKDLPIIDYHCHISPREVFEDRKFENITQVWLGGDHYKWRYMRSSGVDEYYITGGASDKEKFFKSNKTVRGSGIGLAVADEIVKQHQGLIFIESVEGVGTTVTVALPLYEEPEEIDTVDVVVEPEENGEGNE